MKSLVAMLLLVAALAWADTSYDNFQNYQNHHDQSSSPSSNYYDQQGHHDQTTSLSSNYYDQQGQPIRRVGSGLTGLLKQYLSPIRRQGLAGLFAALLPFLGPMLAFFVVLFIAFIIFSYYQAIFSSSGRGLDTDEWEVDHSIWMNQLQKDFEQSWSQE